MSSDFHSTRPEQAARAIPGLQTILQIRTRPADALADQALLPAGMEVIDLTVGEPDYDSLLEAVFRAGRVQVW